MKRKDSIPVLTNDPSLTEWGYAVVDIKKDFRLPIITAGCIKTKAENKKRRIRKGDDDCRRVREIVVQLSCIIKQHNVQYIVSELPHGSQVASGAKMIGVTIGVLESLSDALEISLEWYSEADAKKALLEKRSATKRETINAITEIYEVPWTGVKYKDEAMADAMAIYHVASQLSPTLNYLKRHD